MKLCIFIVLILITLLTVTFSQNQTQNTRITYKVEYEHEQEQDYIEITLSISAKDTSLALCISQANQTERQVKQKAMKFCDEYSEKKNDCKDIIEIDNFDIQPKYRAIKKEPTYIAIIVVKEVRIKVSNVDQIGLLVDQLLKLKGVKIDGFEWKAQKEKQDDKAIEQGLAQGKKLCLQLGLDIGRVIEIEELDKDDSDDDKDKDQDDDEDDKPDDDQEVSMYKFEIECKVKEKKKSKNKEIKKNKEKQI